MKKFVALQNIVDPTTTEACFRPYYEYKWPQDLPSQCENCGMDFRVRTNLQFGPRRAARILRKISKFSMIASLSAFFLLVAIFVIDGPEISPDLAWITGMAITACILFVVSPVTFFVSIFTPEIRHLECNKCHWNRDFPLIDSLSNNPNQDIR